MSTTEDILAIREDLIAIAESMQHSGSSRNTIKTLVRQLKTIKLPPHRVTREAQQYLDTALNLLREALSTGDDDALFRAHRPALMDLWRAVMTLAELLPQNQRGAHITAFDPTPKLQIEQDVEDWIKDTLNHGPLPEPQLYAQAETAGYNKHQVNHALRRLSRNIMRTKRGLTLTLRYSSALIAHDLLRVAQLLTKPDMRTHHP